MEILVVAPHGSVDVAALGTLPEGARLTAVSWQGEGESSGVEVVGVPPRTGPMASLRARLLRIAAANLILRSLLRLSGFDEGRWFWTAAAKTAAAAQAAQAADVIIAADRDAVYTAWRWGHAARRAGRATAAVHGYPAGRAAIAAAGER
ncbi:MAG: hypothetical protein ACTHJM_14385 [Marmoricola sp.]